MNWEQIGEVMFRVGAVMWLSNLTFHVWDLEKKLNRAIKVLGDAIEKLQDKK